MNRPVKVNYEEDIWNHENNVSVRTKRTAIVSPINIIYIARSVETKETYDVVFANGILTVDKESYVRLIKAMTKL